MKIHIFIVICAGINVIRESTVEEGFVQRDSNRKPVPPKVPPKPSSTLPKIIIEKSILKIRPNKENVINPRDPLIINPKKNTPEVIQKQDSKIDTESFDKDRDEIAKTCRDLEKTLEDLQEEINKKAGENKLPNKESEFIAAREQTSTQVPESSLLKIVITKPDGNEVHNPDCPTKPSLLKKKKTIEPNSSFLQPPKTISRSRNNLIKRPTEPFTTKPKTSKEKTPTICESEHIMSNSISSEESSLTLDLNLQSTTPKPKPALPKRSSSLRRESALTLDLNLQSTTSKLKPTPAKRSSSLRRESFIDCSNKDESALAEGDLSKEEPTVEQISNPETIVTPNGLDEDTSSFNFTFKEVQESVQEESTPSTKSHPSKFQNAMKKLKTVFNLKNKNSKNNQEKEEKYEKLMVY